MDGSGVSPVIISSASFLSDRAVSVRAVTITAGGATYKVAYLYGKYVDSTDKLYAYVQTDGTVVLAMWQGSTNHGYVTYNTGLNPYSWHTFRMVMSGNTATVYVDGTLYVTATDSIIGALGAAPVGLASWGPSESQFDSVTISYGRFLSNNPASSDWVSKVGTWTVVNGYMDGSGTSAQIQSSASFQSDRTVSVRARTITAGGATYKVAYLDGKYVDDVDKLYTYIQTDGTVVLAMWQGGINHGYVYYNSGLSPYDWHTFRLVTSGNTAYVYVDGILYITATDSIIGALGSAPVGLASWGPSESQFDGLTIN
jgi:hypothetical protein